MRNEFIGDIGDFANHGILRVLCGTPEEPVDGLKLGVIEYFNRSTDADSGKSHGNRIGYLKVSKYNNSTYKKCDPALYNALQKLVGKSLASRAELKIDPDRAKSLLPVGERYCHADITARERKDWLKCAIQKMGNNTNFVFVNPDIGIASKKQEKNVGPAYATMEEFRQILKGDKGLIIYQQIGQGMKKGQNAEGFIEKRACRLMHELKRSQLWGFRWRREVGRAYFIVPGTEEDKAKIKERLKAFEQSPWRKKGHFCVREFQCPNPKKVCEK